MKRIAHAAPAAMLALMLLLPVGGGLCELAGCELDLVLPRTIMALEAALMVALDLAARRHGDSARRCTIARLLLPAAAALNIFCFTMAKNGLQEAAALTGTLRRLQTADVVWTAFLTAILLAFAFQRDRNAPRRIGLTLLKIPLWGVPAFLCAVWLMMYLLLGSFGMTCTGEPVPAPDGARIAVPIVYDEGAMGGSTCVEIRSGRQLHLGAAIIRKSPVRIRDGSWRPIEDMEVAWLDADTLMINGEIHDLLP